MTAPSPVCRRTVRATPAFAPLTKRITPWSNQPCSAITLELIRRAVLLPPWTVPAVWNNARFTPQSVLYTVRKHDG
ncbi:hypothetical protein D3C72_2160610 [compost metagenome]